VNSPGERRANKVVAAYEIKAVPIPVEYIAEQEGAEVRHRRFDSDISGLLLRNDDGSVIIGVHASQARSRQRFTVAHELGHYLMHQGRAVIVEHLHRAARVNWRDGTSALASDKEEIEANQFAAALLMPRSLLEAHFESEVGRYDEERLVHLLARRFEVSPQAMRFRLVNLALLSPV
jgi:Zn-dependent peptidase ImmA (M78 family)